MKTISLALSLCLGVLSTLAFGQGTPKLEFEKTTYDFGKVVSDSATVTGAFKCKNVGTGVLKLQQPAPSCGCTVAALQKDTLNPGETSEVGFTVNLGTTKGPISKTITMNSNDPQTPSLVLTIKADFAPLYEITVPNWYTNVMLGAKVANSFEIVRNDGKPLKIDRLDPSKPWITAKLAPRGTGNDSSARMSIDLKGEGPVGSLMEYVHVYGPDKTNSPLASLQIMGQILGELNVAGQLYWSITDPAKVKTEPSEALVVRRASIRSASGKEFELKNLKFTPSNPQTSFDGLKVELSSKEGGKAYEVVAKLTDSPAMSVGGKISFDTSVAAQPKVEIPVTILVLPPQAAQTPTPAPPPPPLLARPTP